MTNYGASAGERIRDGSKLANLVPIRQKGAADRHNKTEGSDQKARNADLVNQVMEINRGLWEVQYLEWEKTARRGLMQTSEGTPCFGIGQSNASNLLAAMSCGVFAFCLGYCGELKRLMVSYVRALNCISVF